jgi:von Willebrand factor type A domain-containing protein
MPRSSALVATVVLFAAIGCGFAPAAPGGSGASGGPLGSGASSGSGTGLVSGGAAQNGHAANSGMNCASVDRPLSKLPPDILIVLDKSGSMDDDASGNSCNTAGCTKWEQTTAALTQVVTATDGAVNWGLKFFTSPGGSACTVNNGVEVPIAANNAGAVNGAINAQMPANSTPTRRAIETGAAYMATVTDANPKFILLATDGLPNCIPGNSDNAASDMSGAISAVTAAAAMGFQTFVIGIATSSDPMSDATLSMMAVQGGRPRMGTPAYYPVMNQADLVAALNQIVVIAGTCIFTIPPPPNDDTNAMRIGVKVDNADLPQDTSHTNGWDFSGTNQVEIYGSQCQAIMNGSVQSVQIVFKCIVN